MKYTFDLIGISPSWQFFHNQHKLQKPNHGIEYLGTHKCTLDGFIKSLEPIPEKWGCNLDQVVDTVVQFWLNNSESICYWKERLNDAGMDNLIVARVADITALQAEFESLLGKNW